MLEVLHLPDRDTVEYWHLLAEVLKCVWRDRLSYLADPGFAVVPVDRLLSKDYAAGRVEALRLCPGTVDATTPAMAAGPGAGTLHVASADADGNLASMTITQGMGFGSCLVVPGTGLVVGHGMCRLDPRPGLANSVAPGKRPLNNTTPMVVEMADRTVAIGLPGGRRIPSVMARAVHLMIDRGWSTHQVAVAPRMHVETAEPMQLDGGVDDTTAAALVAMGHQVKRFGALAGVMNGAEVLHPSRVVRAGSSTPACGVA
jgi:gamma-glutamyltranspeptidase/glutathione hydrolase